MRLVWYQREDGLWNAACTCYATIVGVTFERRADAEARHFDIATIEREFRAKRPTPNRIGPCGPKMPDPNPNTTDAFVFA